ncbi:MAG: capsular exopolysaccharide synthesis family protein [Pseudohongiellaceae bacterium]
MTDQPTEPDPLEPGPDDLPPDDGASGEAPDLEGEASQSSADESSAEPSPRGQGPAYRRVNDELKPAPIEINTHDAILPGAGGQTLAREAAAAGIAEAATAQRERPGGLLSRMAPNIVMYHNSHSVQAEQYRQCRTNLTALNRAGAPWVIAVTSSRKGEGKSVTVANLAVCLAELPGTRVCLLDADTRAPRVASYFGLGLKDGLTEHVRDGVPVQDIVHPTMIDSLDCIHAGEQGNNPAELLGKESFGALLTELRKRYSWILVDTPPVNPFTDAAVVAAQSNGALLVVRLQETPRALVNSTIDTLTTAGGKVIGSFVTGMTPDQADEDHATYYKTDSSNPRESKASAADARRDRRDERKRLKKERAVLKALGKDAQKNDEDPHPV